MRFNDTPRVMYRKNPLQEVICQLSFPTILRINDGSPVEFHEAISSRFPYYDRVVEHMHNVKLTDVDRPFPNTLISHSDMPNHTFESKNHLWRLNLTSSFIALSTHDYTTWDDFIERLQGPLNSLIGQYNIAFFSRIGLRYIDAIDKAELGLSEYQWTDLLTEPVLGMLSINDGTDVEVTQCNQVSELKLDASRSMVVRTGLGNVVGRTDPMFIIDTDMFSTVDVAIRDRVACLNSLHEPVSKYFRWAITDKLHLAMDPVELGD